MGHLVGGEDQQRTHHALGQAGRRTGAPATAHHAGKVGEGVQDLGGAGPNGVVLKEELLKADAEDVTDAQDQQQDDDGAQARAG